MLDKSSLRQKGASLIKDALIYGMSITLKNHPSICVDYSVDYYVTVSLYASAPF